MSILEIALILAGLLHFGLLLASFSVPRVLDWHTELNKVNSLTRQLVLVHGGFIVLTIIGLGTITLVGGRELLAGNVLSLAVTLFMAVFWSTRLLLQIFYFEAGPWLTTPFLKAGYRALYGVFVYFIVVYSAAAWVNVRGVLGM